MSISIHIQKNGAAVFLNQLNRKESYFHSWSCAVPEFQEFLDRLRKRPLSKDESYHLINTSSGKNVWRCREELNGEKFDFAYKLQKGKKAWRYWFRPSLPVRECRNYAMLEALGVPTAEVLAAGDLRRMFFLRESFLITRFIAGSRDGRCFMPGGELEHDTFRKQEYSRKNLKELARLHDHGIFHKSFHPRNLLWRETEGEMEIFWIDPSRCRKMSPEQMKRAVITDLHNFFRDMQLDRGQVLSLLAFYFEKRRLPELSLRSLFQELLAFRRRPFSRKAYRLFGKQNEVISGSRAEC